MEAKVGSNSWFQVLLFAWVFFFFFDKYETKSSNKNKERMLGIVFCIKLGEILKNYNL
jgi:hypothetical protein